ncbi:hypothetical protein [Alphabaculovirus myunipunctae]|uniref:Uncharacterized protein n=1 Tax=Mythimna unipuncta nucleopolyhedrovirus TaxID=447897 RepID=A0A2K9VSA3_9ABAC|nr:hypothetical protein [Mythimna unipuncta nucleopolyhedrovirus]AUV65324.1 hypothetical protein [Mythimna unipuncta nucleopolyhedrovirus]
MVICTKPLTLPGLYAELPPGWYYYHLTHYFDNNPEPREEVLLAVCPSEIDMEFQQHMCQYWSETLDDWDDTAESHCNWDNPDNPNVSIEQAANEFTLIDQCIRNIFGEDVFSQRFSTPWLGRFGRDPINIDEIEQYYKKPDESPIVFKRFVRLPSYFNVSLIDNFCTIHKIK